MPKEWPESIALSYETEADGMPPSVFNYDPNVVTGVCPVTLPASGEEAIVLTTRAGVVAALSSRDFGVQPLTDRHAVTGAVCQSPNGLLRLDKPDVTEANVSLGLIFQIDTLSGGTQKQSA
jgi:hypothetical protein